MNGISFQSIPKTSAWQDRGPKGPARLVVEGEAQLDECYRDF